jgi:flagellar L-ring protein precursor FlgH
MSARPVRIFAALAAAALVSGCATHTQNLASADFAPVYLAPPQPMDTAMAGGSIFVASQGGFVAGDRRARQVGDILTVSFSERFQATKSQNAGSSKTSDFGITLAPLIANPLGAISSDLSDAGLAGGTTSSFAGSGTAAQSNSLSGRMSVSVVRVFSNGNLEILGEKKLTLNNGDEYVRVRGIVRAEDISASNVVLSERIANAEIKYIGAGDVADTARQGWLSRALAAVSPY